MFSRAIRLFTVQGFAIKVDPSWFVVAALITWSLTVHYFPLQFPGQSQAVYLGMAVAAMLGFFASLLLHELSHSVVARRHGVRVASITLFLLGGMAEMQEDPPTADAEIQISLAGPVASFALALGFGLANVLWGQIATGDPVGAILGYLSAINLILALFNLLPAFPLDGGRVLRAWLWKRSGNILSATETAAKSGLALAAVLIGLGLLSFVSGYLVSGLWQVLLGGFLALVARSSHEQQIRKAAFADLTVFDAMTPNPVTVEPGMTLSHVIEQIVLRRGLSFLPVVEDQVLIGKIDQDVLMGIDRENWSSTRIDDVFVDLANETLLSPQTPIPDLFRLIGSTRQRKFLVTEGHRLVGVISLADLARYMRLAPLLTPAKHSADET